MSGERRPIRHDGNRPPDVRAVPHPPLAIGGIATEPYVTLELRVPDAYGVELTICFTLSEAASLTERLQSAIAEAAAAPVKDVSLRRAP